MSAVFHHPNRIRCWETWTEAHIKKSLQWLLSLILVLAFYGLNLPVAHEYNIPPPPDTWNQFNYYGSYNVLYKSNPPSEPKPVKPKPNLLFPCNCVLHAQAIGLKLSGYKVAKNYPINSNVPNESGWVVTYESSAGHMGHYTLHGIYLLLDDEANYVACQITHNRLLPISSKLIKGYIN